MNRAVLAAGCIAVLAACQQNTAPAASHSPVSSPPTSPSVVAAASPSPEPDLPLSRVAFSCRLPVVDSKSSGGSTTLQGGFITFPQATYAADPDGVIQSEYAARDYVTTATPALHGTGGGAFYDAAMRRWVPVASNQASPDGRRYAYIIPGPTASSSSQIHVVGVVDGSERTVTAGPTGPGAFIGWQIGDFDGRVAYLTGSTNDGPVGLWHFDTTTGASENWTLEGPVFAVRSGVVWVGRYASNPASWSGNAYRSDSLWQMDFRPAAKYFQVRWIDTGTTGAGISMVGLDRSGHPIVSISPPLDYNYTRGDIRLIINPGEAGTEISKGMLLGSPQADVGRIWFSNDRGIYVFTAAHGLQKVFAWNPSTSGETLTPAGYCR